MTNHTMVDNYETITVAVGLPLMPALKVVAVLRVRPRNKSYQMIRSFQLLQPLRAAGKSTVFTAWMFCLLRTATFPLPI